MVENNETNDYDIYSENDNMCENMIEVVDKIDIKQINIEENKIKINNKKRYFCGIILDPNNNIIISGKYSGIKPKQAAYKVLSYLGKLYETNKKEFPNNVKFGIYEIRKNQKIFVYSGYRQHIDTKQIIKNKNNEKREINFQYKNKIKKIKYSDCDELINKLKNINIIRQQGCGSRIKYLIIK
jgi:hypothetical protein